MRDSRTWALCFLFVMGCGNGCGGTSEATGNDGEETASGGGEGARAEPEVEPGPAPTVRVRAERDRHSRAVTAHIESLGPEPARVGALALQRQEGERWVDVEADLALRDSCDGAPRECVTLVPGAAFIPPPWTGDLGDAQCDCERCVAARAGTYRFVARGCDPTDPAEGEPFVLE